jgi:Ran GTPase-activating protein (RanGAP) involved in mRNA processing and transport
MQNELKSCAMLDDLEIHAIAEKLMNNHIIKLALAYNRIGDRVIILCKAFKHNFHLKKLIISLNRITDSGVQILVKALKRNTVLQTLDLRFNLMGDVGAKALVRLIKRNSPAFEHLNVYGNTDISHQGEQFLVRAAVQSPSNKKLTLVSGDFVNFVDEKRRKWLLFFLQ